MDNSSAQTYSQISEELLSSMDLARLSRKHRTKSDYSVVYDLAKEAEGQSTRSGSFASDEDSTDDGNPLLEDGLSDSEFAEGQGAESERPRFDTFDDVFDGCNFNGCYCTAKQNEYHETLSMKGCVTPAYSNSERVIATTSEQIPLGVVAATPSNPVTFICCAPSFQCMTSGTFSQPYQYVVQMASMSSMVSHVGTNSSIKPVTVSAEPCCNASPGELNVKIASEAEKAASVADGQRSPSGSWNGTAAVSKQAATERTKPSGRQNVKKNGGSRTTVMLQNLPSYFTRDMVLDLLECLGYAHKYDFVHMHTDLIRLSCLGFAFVNFRLHEDAMQFSKDANGFKSWPRPSNKVLNTSWSKTGQTLPALIQKYRNAPVMHPSVPEQCKPLLFGKGGAQLPFPRPTIELKAPGSK